MREKTAVEWALEYSQYFPVYPLSPNRTIPLKGSKGHKDATQAQEDIVSLFTELAPETNNLGASFIGTDYFVIDLDIKGGKNGLQNLSALQPKNDTEGLGKPVVVHTKNNGLHLYYKTKDADKIQHEIDWIEGVDILRRNCVLPPTVAPDDNGELKQYRLKEGHSFKDAVAPPEWLMSAIIQSQRKEQPKGKFTLNYSNTKRTKKYTAVVIEEFVEGAKTGNRNEWITKQVGRLLYLGANPETVFTFIHVVNERFIDPPLKTAEVDSVIKSMLKREASKKGG